MLAASGAFTSSAYHGSANTRPAGVHAGRVELVRPTATAPGAAEVSFSGNRLPLASHHVAAILLTDVRTGLPVSVNYQADTSIANDAAGQISGARLTVPAGTQLPRYIRAYVIVDAFPIRETVL